MKTAFNIVKFRVKPGKEMAFEAAQREAAFPQGYRLREPPADAVEFP